jgi:V/A-type H+-transporting ATPase subunit K
MERWIKVSKRFNAGLGIAALLLFTCAPLVLVESTMAQGAGHADAATDTPAMGQGETRCWAFMAAAIATGIGSLAAGYAVAQVGTAAMGAVAEKPELMGKSLIYVALAEGIAIYGLLIAIIVLAKV